MVFDEHVSGKSRVIGHDDVVTQNTIVSNVSPNHQEVAVSNLSLATPAFSAAVHVDVLTKHVARADCQKSFFTDVLEILRLNADNAEGKESVVAADGGRPLNDDMRVQDAPVSQG